MTSISVILETSFSKVLKCFPDTCTRESGISTKNDILPNKEQNIITFIVELRFQLRHNGKAGYFFWGGGALLHYTRDTLVIFYKDMKP